MKIGAGCEVKKGPYRNKEATETMDEMHNRKCDQIKKLNYAQYLTKKKEKELTDLVLRFKVMVEMSERHQRMEALPTSQKSKNRMLITDIGKCFCSNPKNCLGVEKIISA